MPENTQIKRRLPAIEKSINDIDSAHDVRVRILGTILDTSEDTILIDDGTAKTEVIFENEQMVAGIRNGEMVRVVARVLPLIDGFALRGEVVQRLEDFDIGMYKRARELTA